MSKLKINTSDWIDLIASQADVSKKDAGDFIKALLTVMEEALLSGDSVKIKGLGTFKLQWNAPRKSVDVNTGEDIIIDGYYRVSFTPDAELRDLANEPYAHLEAVAIDEIEDRQKVKKEADDSDEIPLKHFDEQVTEIKDILSEINALNHTDEMQQDSDKQDTKESDVEKSESEKQEVVEQSTDKSDAIEKNINKPADKKPKKKKSKPEDRKKQTVRAESTVRERKSSDSPDLSEKRSSRYNDFEEKSKNIPASKSKRLDLLFIAVLGGGLLVYLAIDHKIITTISRYIESYRIQKALAPDLEEPATSPENQDFDASQSDFGPVESESVTEDKSDDIGQSQVDDLEQLFNQTRSYHDFIATEEVIPGSRLTRIAERHYGVKEFWVYIYEANRDILESPAEIEPGMLLKIPRLNPVLADKDNPRCIEYALKLQEEYLKE